MGSPAPVEATDARQHAVANECAGRQQVWLKTLSTVVRPLTGWAAGRSLLDTAVAGTDPSAPLVNGVYVAPGPCAINCSNFRDPYSFHSGGANAVFGDGSVHFLSETMPLYVLATMFTRNAGEVVPPGFYN